MATLKETIPSLFCYNGVLVASDGLDADEIAFYDALALNESAKTVIPAKAGIQ